MHSSLAPASSFSLKRDGCFVKEQFYTYLQALAKRAGIEGIVDVGLVVAHVQRGLCGGITREEIVELAAETSASLSAEQPEYADLAAYITIDAYHQRTSDSFSATMHELHEWVNPKTQRKGKFTQQFMDAVDKYADRIQATIDYSRDYYFSYFGFKTLQRSYLLGCGNDEKKERPQHLFFRVLLALYPDDIDQVCKLYEMMSKLLATHATPTLFNAGTINGNLASCFLLSMQEDSIEGIYETLKRCARLSKACGGIGLSVQKIRAHQSYIQGSNGYSSGIIPMLRVYDSTASYVDQGGGKRKGAIAVYLEPWHADIFAFLDLRKNQGKEEMRCRNLFTALWIPDLFMERVQNDAHWSLFCPNEAPDLDGIHGDAFRELYCRYEREGTCVRATIQARDLWLAILDSQMETGTPFMLYKDSINAKSNQNNLGYIPCSNLCTEIIQYSDAETIAVCSLASVCLPRFVDLTTRTFDFNLLISVVRAMTRNLNQVLDSNNYPLEEARKSAIDTRAIGIGVQGLADTFILLGIAWEDEQARYLNARISATIYWAAMSESIQLAKEHGRTYPTYEGSMLSKGILQCDLWNMTAYAQEAYDSLDFATLRTDLARYGAYNSMLVAQMPTASTSQIMGSMGESVDPIQSNIYTRRVLAGDFIQVNKLLIHELRNLGLWNKRMKDTILVHNGSIQAIPSLPDRLKRLFKTVWEIPQRTILDLNIDRSPFVCQSVSLNIHMGNPTYDKLSSLFFYGWRNGLKTGQYYLRRQAVSEAVKFTVEIDGFSASPVENEQADDNQPCSDTCESCSA